MSDLRVAYYGDDVTGSVDVLLQFARRGVSGRLFIGLPPRAALDRALTDHGVVGIAGIARSLRTAELDDEVRPALAALAATGADIVQYKACSTADSSPEIGSLGRVLEIAHDVVGTATVPLLFAQPDFGRYTVFGHHFAAEAGTVHRLDRQPTMSSHPSTPMHESDLARHVGRQTALAVGSLPLTTYTSPDALVAALASESHAAVVLDALDDEHLRLIGDALARTASARRPLFTIGSGGLSRAIALTLPDRPARLGSIAASGPILAVSGSRSPQTRRQIEHAAAAGWLVRALPAGSSDATDPEYAEVVAALRRGQSVALTSDGFTGAGSAGDTVLESIAEAAATVLHRAVRDSGVRRVVVCGGDTSGRVVRLLGVDSVSIGGFADGNVVLLRAESADPAIDGIEVVLKGGQVGSVDLLERLRAGIGVGDTIGTRTAGAAEQIDDVESIE